MLLEFTVPSVRKILRSQERWAPLAERAGHGTAIKRGREIPLRVGVQSIVPEDPELHRKLGIGEKQTVLVVGGGHGDWANALSQKSEVHYSDASLPMKKLAEARFAGKGIKSFAVADAMMWPRKAPYDWVFAYQPAPYGNTSLPIAILRAVAHAKGCVFVTDRLEIPKKVFDIFGDHFSRIYKAGYESSPETIKSRPFGLRESVKALFGGKHEPVWVFRVRASESEEPRKQAQADLKVLKAASDEGPVDIRVLAGRLGMSESRVVESLARLTHLSNLLDEKAHHKVVVEMQDKLARRATEYAERLQHQP